MQKTVKRRNASLLRRLSFVDRRKYEERSIKKVLAIRTPMPILSDFSHLEGIEKEKAFALAEERWETDALDRALNDEKRLHNRLQKKIEAKPTKERKKAWKKE